MFCSRALPHERHIARLRESTPSVNANRVRAGYLDLHGVVVVDPKDVESRCGTASAGESRGGPVPRFQADPYDAKAGSMYQTHVAYSYITVRGAAHEQHRPVAGRRNRCTVRIRSKVVRDKRRVGCGDRLRGIRYGHAGENGYKDSQEHGCPS